MADQRRENIGDYHNPTRERGIFSNTASNAKAQSLADAAGWDSRKHATSKGRSWGYTLPQLCSEIRLRAHIRCFRRLAAHWCGKSFLAEGPSDFENRHANKIAIASADALSACAEILNAIAEAG